MAGARSHCPIAPPGLHYRRWLAYTLAWLLALCRWPLPASCQVLHHSAPQARREERAVRRRLVAAAACVGSTRRSARRRWIWARWLHPCNAAPQGGFRQASSPATCRSRRCIASSAWNAAARKGAGHSRCCSGSHAGRCRRAATSLRGSQGVGLRTVVGHAVHMRQPRTWQRLDPDPPGCAEAAPAHRSAGARGMCCSRLSSRPAGSAPASTSACGSGGVAGRCISAGHQRTNSWQQRRARPRSSSWQRWAAARLHDAQGVGTRGRGAQVPPASLRVRLPALRAGRPGGRWAPLPGHDCRQARGKARQQGGRPSEHPPAAAAAAGGRAAVARGLTARPAASSYWKAGVHILWLSITAS